MPESATIDLSDIGIAIVTILFALSLISERIANLIKPIFFRRSRAFYLRKKEKIRDYKVLVLSVLCGLLTAFIAGADFFTLVQEGKLVNIYILTKTQRSEFCTGYYILGLFLSGIFISLGSKFWHDMLDIVLQFSSLRKLKINEQSINMQGDVNNLIRIKKLELKEKIINILPLLQNAKNFAGYNITGDSIDEIIVEFKFSNETPKKEDIKWLNKFLEKQEYKLLISNSQLHAG